MTRKKVFKGVVLTKFKIGKIYEISKPFQTTDKKLYNHLINTKRIK